MVATCTLNLSGYVLYATWNFYYCFSIVNLIRAVEDGLLSSWKLSCIFEKKKSCLVWYWSDVRCEHKSWSNAQLIHGVAIWNKFRQIIVSLMKHFAAVTSDRCALIKFLLMASLAIAIRRPEICWMMAIYILICFRFWGETDIRN
jgi:hypothetical protein